MRLRFFDKRFWRRDAPCKCRTVPRTPIGRHCICPRGENLESCGELSFKTSEWWENMPRRAKSGFAKAALMKLQPRQLRLVVLGVALLLGSATGCVRRRLLVRTGPPGALVSVDNQIIGASPAASPFTFYGTREIRVEKDGYRTETIRRKLNPPWYEYPPLDFITETLWPFEIRDERVIDIELVPKEIDPLETVIGRADQLRDQSRQGVVTAPTNIGVPAPASPSDNLLQPPRGPAQVITPPEQLPYGGVPLP